MKKWILFVVLFSCSLMALWSQMRTHTIRQGETVQTIAKYYRVTPFDLQALNPELSEGLQPGMVIRIPSTKISEKPIEVREVQLLGYNAHKVKRKETLFGIARQYNITVDDLKQHNPRLYSENLQRGDKINIPRYGEVTVLSDLENTLKKYRVGPKEGKWRIAYKFGISVDELDDLNPGIGDVLQLDQEINVPNISENEERPVDETYGYYTVQPSEGFYRLRVKLGLTQDQLEALNPELKSSGLKNGMILKVPLSTDVVLENSGFEKTALTSKLSNFNRKRLAVMLPFRVNRIDFDSIEEAKDILRNDRLLTVALDFYTGVRVAADSAKRLGIPVKMDVFDTEARISTVSYLLKSKDFSDYDAVIGPFIADNLDRVAADLRSNDIPVISPVTKPVNLYNNVFQTVPNDRVLKERAIRYIKSDTAERTLLIISDSKHKAISNELKSHFPKAIQISSKTDKDGKEGYFIVKEDVEEIFNVEGKFLVFLETANEGFVSNVTSLLNAFNGPNEELEIEEREIMLVTTNRNRAFENSNISNFNLSDLKFHYPSINRPYDYQNPNAFVRSYIKTYGAAPSRYAVRGFDLTLDVLMRLATGDDLYAGSTDDLATEYVENKFRYSKKLFGGYVNDAIYMVKFDDLNIVELPETMSPVSEQ